MMLSDQVAVVYGAGGAVGGAVARALAGEGARVFVIGRGREAVDAVAKDIAAAGGSVEAATVDTLDEPAIDAHLRYVVDRAGRVDISVNAAGPANAGIIGVPLTELDPDTFLRPIMEYTRSYLLTARLAARYMIPNRSGVIMTITALPGRRGTVRNGGYGPAMAAKEAMTRDLSAELGPSGIRVVGLRPHGLPGTRTMRDTFELKYPGVTEDQFEQSLAASTHSRRIMSLEEVADMATFVASDQARGLTGTTVNLTMGSLDD